MSGPRKARFHIVAGPPGPLRRKAIQQFLTSLPRDARVSVVLEGLSADGSSDAPGQSAESLHILAPGCPCCIGTLTLRVTLARILRIDGPEHLLIGIIDPGHEASLRRMLLDVPWGDRLESAT